MAELARLGFEPVYDDRIFERTRYVAGAPAVRAELIEDAWRDPLLQKRWTHFAQQLTPEQAEQLVQRAAKKQLSNVRVQSHAAPTDGWALERQGFRAAA